MKRYAVAWVAAILVAGVCGLRAQNRPDENLARAQRSTALVKVEEFRFQTAVCIDPSGLFLTCAQAVEESLNQQAPNLVLFSETPAQKNFTAKVIRLDHDADLAVLRIDAPPKLEAIQFAANPLRAAGDEVVLIGYPSTLSSRSAGPGLALKTDPLTPVITRLHVSPDAVPGATGGLKFQKSVAPGNCGGPLLDGAGRMVGLCGSQNKAPLRVEKGIAAAAIREWLSSPTVHFTPPSVKYEKRSEPADFDISLEWAVGAPRNLPVVELSLRSNSGPERVIRATPVAGKTGAWRAKAAPAPQASAQQPVHLRVDLPGGFIAGLTADIEFHAGSRTLKLSDISTIQHPPTGNAQILLADGSNLQSETSGLGDLVVDLGGSKVHVNTGQATQLTVIPSSNDEGVAYRVIVRVGSKVVAQLSGTLPLDRLATIAPLHPPALGAAPLQLQLPAQASDVQLGADGRMVVLVLSQLQKAAVVDLNEFRIAGYLPLPDDRRLLATGADSLIVSAPREKQIERYNLFTLRRETSAPYAWSGLPVAGAMGRASRGPVLLSWAAREPPAPGIMLRLLEGRSLAPIAHSPIQTGTGGLSASAKGDLFVTGGSYMGCLTIKDGLPHFEGRQGLTEYLVPGLDGTLYSNYAIFGKDLKVLLSTNSNRTITEFIPVMDEDWYLAFPRSARTFSYSGTVHRSANPQPLGELPYLREMATLNVDQPYMPLSIAKRIFFFAKAKVLVTLSATNDLLVMRRVDLSPSVEAANGTLAIASTPPDPRFNEEMVYPIRVKNQHGALKFELLQGPRGLTVSSEGVVRWEVPFGEIASEVAVLVRDASGMEVVHRFSVHPR